MLHFQSNAKTSQAGAVRWNAIKRLTYLMSKNAKNISVLRCLSKILNMFFEGGIFCHVLLVTAGLETVRYT